MRQVKLEQQQDNSKVAPIISQTKLSQFIHKVISTVLGLSIIAHYDYHGQDDIVGRTRGLAIFGYLMMPVFVVVPASVIRDESLHALAVLLPMALNTVYSIICDIVLSTPKHTHKYTMTALYSFLWAVHLYITDQLHHAQLIQHSTYIAIMALSITTILTSSSTIHFSPVRQFSASTFDYKQFNIHSTLYVRFYVQIPILVTQLGIFYSGWGIMHPALPVLQFVVGLSFVLWICGWISSLYNNIMYFVNNLLNCLIFGQQLSHSGNKYRGTNMWWVSYMILLLNVIAIGSNVALVLSMQARGQPIAKIVEHQHVLLICLASLSSLVTAVVYYFSYRCSQHKKSLIRLNKFQYAQVAQVENSSEQNSNNSKKKFKGNFFCGHKQVFMIVANLLVPAVVCLLAVFAFAKYYNAYNNGTVYQLQTNFIAQKTVTCVILAANVGFYLFFVVLKQLTRVRSKLGCSVNPCCFNQFYAEVQRDLFIKIILKLTGALSIMALVLRVQHIQVFSDYIMHKTPLGPEPHPAIQFFITCILFPALVYRSYKRSQNFTHFFHITIIVALILTAIDSTLYFYESIFVVLAFPNFPDNPFRLLLLSPFTVPPKLVHKNECCYRIGYLLVNFLTFFIYVATLGTLEFTMIFGLPMYWCVIPSISCQSPKNNNKVTQKRQVNLKQTMSQFEISSQSFNSAINNQTRSTPQHNLYQKIVSQIPFYMFRNKQPGYYLLRINKYILLVQVVMDFYGIFETVTLIGLQAQEVTTCHAKQGETIDRMVQQTWGDNPNSIQSCVCNQTIHTVIHEEHHIRNAKITGQNEIQLTGIIQSEQFYQLFKKCLIKSLIYNYNKMLKRNPKSELTAQQHKDAQILLDDLQGRISKDKIDQFFPHTFVAEAKNDLVFSVKFKQMSSKGINKKKLPPINQKANTIKKQKIIDDFADLIGGSSNTSNLLQPSVMQQNKQKIDIDKLDEQSIIKQQGEDKKQSSELHMGVIVSAYLSILGQINYLKPDRLYKIMKKDGSVLSRFQFQGGLDLVSVAVGCALKIAIGKQLMAEDDAEYSDYIQYTKNQFLGTLESAEFSEAIEQQKQDIWTISYHQTKKILSVKRLAKNETPIYMFSFENHAVQAVWNNLRFELLFATNDNDERYSIQTHPYLLRNLLVEACEEPYGYAGYYSQQFINL